MTEEVETKKTDPKRWLKLLLKLAVTVICFWYISNKINWNDAWQTILHANWLWLVPAFFLFILSKIVSAIRLNLYFKNANVHLSLWQNLKLYWLGMFYNLFLPGSISGDAYKVFVLKKRYDASYKKTGTAVLLDRFSGLLGLGLILSVFSFFVFPDRHYSVLILLGALTGTAALYFVTKKWMSDFTSSFISTLLLGIAVQSLQIISIICIIKAVGITEQYPEYIFIFLLSSVASVLPLTIGGLGIREVVFLEGSKWFGLTQEISVGISLIFYLLTLIASAIGAYYVFADPLEKKKDSLLSP